MVDFGRYVAGPYCACLLGDLGADVIRVERVQGGEDRFVVPAASDGSGILFLQVNRNKRGVTLDPMAAEGREVLRRLVASADVVVANLPGPTLAAMGLDYDSVRAVRADIVLTTVDAFGSGGPYSDRLGFDGVGQSFSGSVYLSGEQGTPSKAYVPWVDYTSAALAAMGTLAALLWRERTGEGQHVEGALIKSALTVAGGAVVEQAVLAPDRVPSGNRSQIAGPSDIFATRDGWIIVQVIGQPLFRRWADLMGDPEWLTDPRFADDDSRGRNGEVLSERMAAWCAGRTTAEALAALEASRVPAGPVHSPQQVLEDPHVQAIGFLQATDYPGLPRPAPLPRTPVELSASPGSVRRRAPQLGEHTDQVLAELGYSQREVAELRRAGVV